MKPEPVSRQFRVNSLGESTGFQDLKEYILSGITVLKPDVPLNNVVGLNEIKRDILDYLNKSADLENAGNLEYNDRILLFGDNSLGKSHLSRAIATELNANLIHFPFSCLHDNNWKAKMNQCVKALYEICKEKGQTTILFMKFLDAYGNPELIQQAITLIQTVQSTWKTLDDGSTGTSGSNSSRLIIISTTHKPRLVDTSLVNCFDRRIYTPTLNFDERRQYFQESIRKQWELGHGMTSIDFDWLAIGTYGILTLEIERSVQYAIEVQWEKHFENQKRNIGIPQDCFQPRSLQFGDFEEVFRARNFSVPTAEALAEFRMFQRRFGNGPFMTMSEREGYDMDLMRTMNRRAMKEMKKLERRGRTESVLGLLYRGFE